MFRTVPLSIIRSFSLDTQQWYMSYWFADSYQLSAKLYVLLCVQWKTPNDVQRNCPKHVDFYYKNKFEKLVHLIGFIIRILERNVFFSFTLRSLSLLCFTQHYAEGWLFSRSPIYVALRWMHPYWHTEAENFLCLAENRNINSPC